MLVTDVEGISPWTQISYEDTIFDAEHDDLKIFQTFENFGKSRNQFWDPPLKTAIPANHPQIIYKTSFLKINFDHYMAPNQNFDNSTFLGLF